MTTYFENQVGGATRKRSPLPSPYALPAGVPPGSLGFAGGSFYGPGKSNRGDPNAYAAYGAVPRGGGQSIIQPGGPNALAGGPSTYESGKGYFTPGQPIPLAAPAAGMAKTSGAINPGGYGVPVPTGISGTSGSMNPGTAGGFAQPWTPPSSGLTWAGPGAPSNSAGLTWAGPTGGATPGAVPQAAPQNPSPASQPGWEGASSHDLGRFTLNPDGSIATQTGAPPVDPNRFSQSGLTWAGPTGTTPATPPAPTAAPAGGYDLGGDAIQPGQPFPTSNPSKLYDATSTPAAPVYKPPGNMVYSTFGDVNTTNTSQNQIPIGSQEKRNLAGTLEQTGVYGNGPTGSTFTEQGMTPTAYQERQNLERNEQILQQGNSFYQDPYNAIREGATGTYSTPGGGAGAPAPSAGGVAGNPQNAIPGYADDPFLADWNKKYEEAKAANESRYGAIRGGTDDTQAAQGGYLGRYDRAMALQQGLGRQELADVNQQYDKLGGGIQQDMVSRGLSGTTIAPTMQMGLARERGDALGRTMERLRREQIGLDSSLSGDQLAFMERRNDGYPDANALAALAYKYGASGPGLQQVNPLTGQPVVAPTYGQTNQAGGTPYYPYQQGGQVAPGQQARPFVNANGQPDVGDGGAAGGGNYQSNPYAGAEQDESAFFETGERDESAFFETGDPYWDAVANENYGDAYSPQPQTISGIYGENNPTNPDPYGFSGGSNESLERSLGMAGTGSLGSVGQSPEIQAAQAEAAKAYQQFGPNSSQYKQAMQYMQAIARAGTGYRFWGPQGLDVVGQAGNLISTNWK